MRWYRGYSKFLPSSFGIYPGQNGCVDIGKALFILDVDQIKHLTQQSYATYVKIQVDIFLQCTPEAKHGSDGSGS
jgi:hypothetical protein